MKSSQTNLVCEFCGKGFISETRLINHLCQKKRRFLQRDDKSVKLAFMAYQRFYQRAMGAKSPPSLTKFEESQFYVGFVDFARYLLDVNPSNPMLFVDFLVQMEAPLHRWTDPTYYGRYIRELNKNESLVDAIDRSFKVMEHWGIETGQDWRDFFRLLSPAKATLWIINGRISPWLLFTASSAPDLFSRFNSEQLTMVHKAIDLDYWNARLERHQAEVAEMRSTLSEYRI